MHSTHRILNAAVQLTLGISDTPVDTESFLEMRDHKNLVG